MKIKNIHLKTNDLQASKNFYENVLGFKTLAQTEQQLVLGNKEPLLYFHKESTYQGHPSNFTGLYHFALLLNSETELENLLYHIVQNQYPLSGAADHIYSQALYLQDPNGYGIEVYVDRPQQAWVWEDEYIKSATLPLDAESLLDKRNGTWEDLPNTAMIGHIHLQTNDLYEAKKLYIDQLGLQEMSLVPSALFLSDHNYHHDIALNAWNRQIQIAQADSLAMLYFTLENLQTDFTIHSDYLLKETEHDLLFQDKSGIRFKIIKKIQD